MQVSLIIYNAVDVSELNILAFTLHLENKVIDRSVVSINATSNGFHQLVFFSLCAAPSVDAIRTEPVCPRVCINVRNGGNENGAVRIQVLQNNIDQIFQTVGNTVIVVAQNIICTDLQQDDIRLISGNHILTVIPSPLNGFQNTGTVFLGCHFLNSITAVSSIVIVIGNGLSIISKCVGIASFRAYHINVVAHLFQVVVHILTISTRSPITVCDGIAQRQNLDCLGIFSSCRCSRNCANCQ